MRPLALLTAFFGVLCAAERVRLVEPWTGPGRTPTSDGKFWDADLGVAFDHKKKLYLVLGDANRDARRVAGSVVGSSSDDDASDGLAIRWSTRAGGLPRQVLKIEHKSMVPAGAVSVDDRIYLFAMNVHKWSFDGPPPITVASGELFRSDDDGRTFKRVLRWSKREPMTNVCPVPGPHPKEPEKKVVWLFTTGKFRRSDVYLAWVAPGDLEKKEKYRYFAGEKDGAPVWSAKIADAKPIVDGRVGELSAQYDEKTNRWLLSYFDFSGPRGRWLLRAAEHPWGPFSEPAVLLKVGERLEWFKEATRPGGDGRLKRVPWGGPYGGFVLPARFNKDGKVFFALSLWVPYRTFLVSVSVRDLKELRRFPKRR